MTMPNTTPFKAQINSLRNSAYLIIGDLGTIAGKVKSLQNKHYSGGELDAVSSALLSTVVKFRGGVFFQNENADSLIARRYDSCMTDALRKADLEQSQLVQIDSLIADAKAVNTKLKQLTLDIEQLKAEQPQAPNIAALYRAATDAAKLCRRINAPLRAIRKDATYSNGISAADGVAGLQVMGQRFNKGTTDKADDKTGANNYEN